MFSRSPVSFLLTLVMFFFAVGCSDFFKGEKEEPKVIELSDSRFTCLQKVPSEFSKFLEGESREKDLVEGFSCLTDALRNFHKRTYGSIENGYTSEELRKFFGKYFLKQNNVTPEFTAELMKLKRILLGGSTVYLTKEELLQLIDMLGQMRDEFVKLAPHMKTLLFQGDGKDLAWKSIDAASDQLRSSLQRFIGETQVASVDYSFEDIKKILYGFAEFVKEDDQFNPYQVYAEWLPIVESVKNVLVGSKAQIAGLSEWRESVDTFVDFYSLLLKHHYSLRNIQWDSIQSMNQLSQFFSQGIQLLMNAHQIKNVGRIPVEDIDNLIDLVLPKIAPESLHAKSIKKAYRAVLLKILDPEKSGARLLLGLEKKHLVSLKREFNIWRLQQSFINSLPLDELNGGITAKELFASYKQFNKTYVIEKNLSLDTLEQTALEQSWKDLEELLNISYPVSFDSQGKLIIHHNIGSIKQTWKSLTESNLMRSLSRLLLLGYGENSQGPLREARMSKQGLIAWYEDFQELGLDLKAFDPRSANSGARSFLEANFFTFSGTGDDYMDQKETYEFVSFLFSAGLVSSEVIRTDFESSQCLTKDNDVFGFPFIQEACFKNIFKEKFSVYFDNLPGLASYVKNLDKTQWDYFFHYLMKAARVEGQKEGLVETANLRTMVMILHYVESVMAVYDRNKDQALSLEEVYAATPRFMSFVKTVSPVSWDAVNTEGFAYLVFKGGIPDLVDLGKFELEKKFKGLKPAQRMELVRLFGTLKDQLNKVKN